MKIYFIIILFLFSLNLKGQVDSFKIKCELKLKKQQSQFLKKSKIKITTEFDLLSENTVVLKLDYKETYNTLSSFYEQKDYSLQQVIDTFLHNGISQIIIENKLGDFVVFSENIYMPTNGGLLSSHHFILEEKFEIFSISNWDLKEITFPFLVSLDRFYVYNDNPIIRFHIILMKIEECEEVPILVTSEWYDLNTID